MGTLTAMLRWLDASPLAYSLIAWPTFAATTVLALLAPERRAGSSPARAGAWLFVAGIFLTLVAFRWPSWFEPTCMNPDEAQMIAGAITLHHFPVYWKYVDGTTHGPICEYLLLLPAWLGAPLNYATARAAAAALLGLALTGVWGTLRQVASERVARLAVLPGLAFWSFVSWEEFVHYSTELAGIALLSLATWAIAAALTRPATDRTPVAPLYFGGLLLGAEPFAKLQSGPQGAALAAGAAALWWLARRPDLASVRRGWLWLGLGGITVPAAVLAFLLVFGLTGQFQLSYLESNLVYAGSGQHPFAEMPGRFFWFASVSVEFAWFLAGCVGFALLYTRPRPGRPAPIRLGMVAAWVFLGISYFCVIRPGRDAFHYLHLLVVPATLLAGFALAGATVESAGDARRFRGRLLPLLVFGALTLAPQICNRAPQKPRFLGRMSAVPTGSLVDAVRYIRERARPGDTLATWGWEPELYVQTGLAQGTREAHSACEITDWPMRLFYLRRYLFDLNRRRPAWFVDAVGPGGFIYKDRRLFAHECTAEVNAIIEKRYDFLAEFGNYRIYRIREAAGN